MSRPIWTGVISFGLLQVPVQLMAAERRHDLRFRLLDSRDKNPIRYERVNSETGEEVPWKEVVKAFEYRKGDYVVLAKDDLDAAAAEATQTIDIEAFVSARDIPPMYFETPYFLVPGKKGEKGYVLLRKTLADSGHAGLARVVIRTRQHLAVLIPVGDALVLNLIRFAQELIDVGEYRFPDRAPKEYRITPRELQMARQLIDSMVTDWDPGQYRDETRDRLRELVDALSRRAGRKPAKKKAIAAEPSGKVVDFMSVLKRSLESQRRTPAAKGARKASGKAKGPSTGKGAGSSPRRSA